MTATAFVRRAFVGPAALAAALALAAGCGGERESRDRADGGTGTGEPAADSVASAPPAPSMPRSPAPADARVFFVAPQDGATVSSPVTFEFGVAGMEVVPAGVDRPGSGHHHLIIDAPPPFDRPIPSDQRHLHFGDGSQSTEIELPPGEHRLTLLFGDYLHVPHEPPVYSETITITVE